jgi:hypothetical protein
MYGAGPVICLPRGLRIRELKAVACMENMPGANKREPFCEPLCNPAFPKGNYSSSCLKLAALRCAI